MGETASREAESSRAASNSNKQPKAKVAASSSNSDTPDIPSDEDKNLVRAAQRRRHAKNRTGSATDRVSGLDPRFFNFMCNGGSKLNNCGKVEADVYHVDNTGDIIIDSGCMRSCAGKKWHRRMRGKLRKDGLVSGRKRGR